MRKILILLAVLGVSACNGKDYDDGVMQKSGKVYTINTETICNARGYHGTTPVKVTVKKDKIVNVEALPNRETPRFFESVKRYMLPKFKDVRFKDYATVDCVSGATISSKCVRENLKAAFDYYTEHK
ncbi:MAG: FMN-binding protein [Bacteroidaceae bacterium]|jgi:electron transport complex protein RnfG|nr:FMN-binding protein [Bacteroidaceae bacterium]